MKTKTLEEQICDRMAALRVPRPSSGHFWSWDEADEFLNREAVLVVKEEAQGSRRMLLVALRKKQ